MKVTVQGQGQVTLLQSDFVAAGGEGSIYCKGTTAYKIYADPKRMLPLDERFTGASAARCRAEAARIAHDAEGAKKWDERAAKLERQDRAAVRYLLRVMETTPMRITGSEMMSRSGNTSTR